VSPSRRAAALAALALWALLLVLAQRIPPFQSPDEHSHLARAYALSRGEVLLHTPPGESSGVRVDRGLVALLEVYFPLVPDAALRLTAAQQQAAQALRWSGDEVFLANPGTGWYLPPIYAPVAAGLALGRALDLPVQASHDLARAIALSASLVVLVAALRLHAAGPLVLLLLALPMSLFQWLSPTLDGLAHALTVWAACAFLRLRADSAARAPPRWALAWTWLAVLALLAGTRPFMLPLLLLPLALHGRAWARLRALSLVLAAAVLAWYVWAAGAVVDLRVARSAGLGGVLRHYAADPADLWRVVTATLGDGDTLRFYGRSFVGVLGWLDTLLPAWAYPALAAALAVVALLSLLRGTAGRSGGWLLLCALACVPLIFAAMLAGWTPLPAQRIEGVQGRYFIAPALLAAAALAPVTAAGDVGAWRRAAGVAAWAAAAAGAAAAVVALWLALAWRYH
jgi:uncharacterized membrane protein